MSPRPTSMTRGGFIPIPKDMNKISWKINHISSGVTTDITNQVTEFSSNIMCTDGISSFNLELDNTDGLYVDKINEGDIIDLYFDFTEKSALSTVRFRFYIDSYYDNFNNNGWSISIEGRDAPFEDYRVHFADTNNTLQFSGRNILDCWLGTSGTIDNQGNYTDGILYQSGLILKVYDTSSSSWKIYKDLSSSQKTTLKALTGYAYSHYETFIDKSRLTMSKSIVTGRSVEFRIEYDSSTDKSYLMVFAAGSIVNTTEHVSSGQNLINISRYGRDTKQEVNRFKQTGAADGNLLLMKTENDTARQNALWIKDKNYVNANLSSYVDVEASATANVNNLKRSPKQGNIQTCALPSLKPGEKVPLNCPYIVNENILIKSFSISIGTDIDFNLQVTKREPTLSDMFKDQINDSTNISIAENLNGMRNANTYDFTDVTGFTLIDCSVQNEFVTLNSGITTGSIQTPTITTDLNLTKFEMRWKGDQLSNCTIKVSNDGANSFSNYTIGTVHTFATSDNRLVVKVTLNESTSGVSPSLEKVSLMWV